MNLLRKISFIFLFSILAISCNAISPDPGKGKLPGYSLNKPSAKLELPKILKEVSGLTDIDKETVALVQDEDGIVFIYDLEKNEIINQFTFDKDGDYEGISRAGNTLYILRSDGKLFEIKDYMDKDAKVTKFDTDISAKDNEGLCYDSANDRLLIANKSAVGKKDDEEEIRGVFSFDLKTKKTSKDPVYELNRDDINDFLKDNNIKSSEKKKSDEVKKAKFKPSAIAVHPITKQLYVLSSVDNQIVIFDQKGKIKGVYLLNKKMFNQPEGITFLGNGDMLISNEGGDEKPTILRFNYGE